MTIILTCRKCRKTLTATADTQFAAVALAYRDGWLETRRGWVCGCCRGSKTPAAGQGQGRAGC